MSTPGPTRWRLKAPRSSAALVLARERLKPKRIPFLTTTPPCPAYHDHHPARDTMPRATLCTLLPSIARARARDRRWRLPGALAAPLDGITLEDVIGN